MPADAQSALEKLKKKFASSMPERLEKIEEACTALPENAYEEETYMNTYRLVHNLKGASGTYGFPEVSQAAAELEELCKACNEAKSPMDGAGRAQAKDRIGRLKTLIEDAVRKASA